MSAPSEEGTLSVPPAEPVVEPAPRPAKVWHYRAHRKTWNVILFALSLGALAAWGVIYTDWQMPALAAGAGVAAAAIKVLLDKPGTRLVETVGDSSGWLVIPLATVLLWMVTPLVTAPLHRNQVIVVPQDTLAKTAAREDGWRVRVLRNGEVVCEEMPYKGQAIVCGGRNVTLVPEELDVIVRSRAAEWKGGDAVKVMCTMPGARAPFEYVCAVSAFPLRAKTTLLKVDIDVPI